METIRNFDFDQIHKDVATEVGDDDEVEDVCVDVRVANAKADSAEDVIAAGGKAGGTTMRRWQEKGLAEAGKSQGRKRQRANM